MQLLGPLAQRWSRGLIIPWLQVRILQGPPTHGLLQVLTFFTCTWLKQCYTCKSPKLSSVAQLAEQSAVNRFVVGSSPTRGARLSKDAQLVGHPFFLGIGGLEPVKASAVKQGCKRVPKKYTERANWRAKDFLGKRRSTRSAARISGCAATEIRALTEFALTRHACRLKGRAGEA